ncbi:DUF2188 domain-containing protein [Saccharopolyspora sp. K220]|uniref:DUF2188 domain-containing protein n=1 Tax=Saccharopolyspora soli TaxID=2926618 RepID=UPI001F5784FD|nr:DUF2188 domain-containing protein [Saccharopolyspora soli]MCI2422679.1 DUF2188 domain-containing protein [Saccharopolyspora soli]
MATWHVRPVPGRGWQVLTPGYTQACAIKSDRQTAVEAACQRIADEGGGEVAVYDDMGGAPAKVLVAASLDPYRSTWSPLTA